jgi:hypothetical protein
MKQCDVPAAFDLDLGYRTLHVEAGKRYYSDEVAGAMPQFVVEDAKATPPPEDDPEPEHTTRSKRS